MGHYEIKSKSVKLTAIIYKNLWLIFDQDPYPTTKTTIARWIRNTMKISGINTQSSKHTPSEWLLKLRPY